MHFGQTRLHKIHDFGQIQNPLDQDLGRNATTTTAACMSFKNRCRAVVVTDLNQTNTDEIL
jgi:hypothetical protein